MSSWYESWADRYAEWTVDGTAANHKLEVVPSCQPKGSGFVCSKVKIVKVY